MNQPSPQLEYSRWPHRFAVLLVGATVALVFVGGLVTTTEAGMAVVDWPTTFGYGMFSFPIGRWLGSGWDLFIEHGHRLLGSIVGIITILYLLTLFRCDRRRWMWGLGVLTLAAVIFQGILGGTRVIENARVLAMVHGCFAPVFLSMCVSNSVFTSRRWHIAFSKTNTQPAEQKKPAVLAKPRDPSAIIFSSGFLVSAILLALLAYGQIVLGAQLRHLPANASAQAGLNIAIFHVVTAVALVLVALAVGVAARRRFREQDIDARRKQLPVTGVRKSAHWIGMLICTQVFLGCATWVLNYGWPAWLVANASSTILAEGFWQTVLTTAHQTTGSLILAACVALIWRAQAATHLQNHTAVTPGPNRVVAAQENNQRTLQPAIAGGAS